MLMMGVIFGLQFVDRSFGPILPLRIEQIGIAHARVPLVAGILFSIMACSGALGHHFCGKLLRRFSTRLVIVGGAVVAGTGSVLVGGESGLGAVRRGRVPGAGHRRGDDGVLHRGGQRHSGARARRRFRRADQRVAHQGWPAAR